MRLEQIQYFLTIAQTGSFTKASKQLYLSQPALSKQMNLLEEELGVRLLERKARGIVLTEAGKQFASDCEQVLQDLERAVERVRAYNKNRKTQIRIGCFDGAVTDDFIPELQASLREIQPDLQIRLSRHSFSENRMALDADQVDVMIELARMDKDGIIRTVSGISEEQTEYRIRVLVHRQGALIYSVYSPLAKLHPPTPEDFANQPYLMVKGNEALWLSEPTLRYLREQSGQKPRIEQVDNFMTMMSNIELGNGFCNLSRDVVDRRPGLLALDLPDMEGPCVVAVWKTENELAERLMREAGESAVR